MKSALTLSMVTLGLVAFMNSTLAQPAQNAGSFPFKLFSKVAAEKPKGNILLSPVSVSTALGMTYPGAAGKTKTALANVLDYGNANDATVNDTTRKTLDSLKKPGGDTKLEIANGLFVDKKVKLKPAFLSTLKQFYDAGAKTLDFKSPAAVTEINSWVSTNTRGKIPTIIEQIGPDAVLYLINAVYFKGRWEYPFEKSNTVGENFATANGGTKKVQMMHLDSSKLPYFENPDFQAISLGYNDKRLSLAVFLPRQGKTLSAFESNFNEKNWTQWSHQFRKSEGHIGLPRFKIEDKLELKKPLSAMGLSVAFDADAAEFPNIGNENMFITKVIHKTFMEVNEEGTEAAAATAVEMATTSAPMNPTPPFHMIVNKPFFIVLYDRTTNKILFAGRINQP